MEAGGPSVNYEKLGTFPLYFHQLQCTLKAEISTFDKNLNHKVSHLYVIDHFCEYRGDIYSPFDLTLVTGMHPYVSLY